jgi:phage shock protein C
MSRRLYRSRTNKMISGLCGGLGDYLDVDPTLLRLAAVTALIFTSGVMFVIYLLAWIIVPQQGDDEEPSLRPSNGEPRGHSWHVYLPGTILILLGGLVLLWQNVWWFSFGDLWPALLIVAGLGMILFGAGHRRSDRTASPSSGSSVGNPNGGTVS